MLRPTLTRLARHLDQPRPSPLGSKSTKKQILSLDHFLQRQRVISLWREIVRATFKIPDQNLRAEMRSFARDEFERHRGVTELDKIRYLLSTGKEQFRSMLRYVDEIGM